jgi:hypothetical protein
MLDFPLIIIQGGWGSASRLRFLPQGLIESAEGCQANQGSTTALGRAKRPRAGQCYMGIFLDNRRPKCGLS